MLKRCVTQPSQLKTLPLFGGIVDVMTSEEDETGCQQWSNSQARMPPIQGGSHLGTHQGVSRTSVGNSVYEGGGEGALFCFLDGLCGWAKMELKGHCARPRLRNLHCRVLNRVQEGVVQRINKKTSSSSKGRGNGSSLLHRTSQHCSRIKEGTRRMRQHRSTYASFVMTLIGFWSAWSVGSLLRLWWKRKQVLSRYRT